MKECDEPDIGGLLHAYELGLLSLADEQRVETHVIGCDTCFAALREFESAALLLRTKDFAAAVVQDLAASHGRNDVKNRHTWRAWLWPDSPLLLRPAISLAVILCLLYPAWLGLNGNSSETVRAVPAVTLLPVRSGETPAVEIDRLNGDVLVVFVTDPPMFGQMCTIQVVGEAGEELFRIDDYRDLDEFGCGRLLIPTKLIHPGIYTLTVSSEDTSASVRSVEYKFRVRH
jgi:hypothetical protein